MTDIILSVLLYVIVAALVLLLIYLIIHPETVYSWNASIALKFAADNPEKRKRAFEMKLNNAVSPILMLLKKAYPSIKKTFAPYSLKTHWVDDDIDSLLKDSRAVLYVNDTNDVLKQTVSLVYTMMEKGFSETVKNNMSDCSRRAIEAFITQKVLQNNTAYIYDHIFYEYLPEELRKSRSAAMTFENLKRLDKQGLYIPILLGELERYCGAYYPYTYNSDIVNIIREFIKFVYILAKKTAGETVPSSFFRGELRIRIIILFNGSAETSIDNIIFHIKDDIANYINTVYVIATGSRVEIAESAANKIYKRYEGYFSEPKKISYTRYGNRPNGAYAACYELCKINRN
ncbi:MAG: hypothetical protein ACYCWE_09055 [Eubacteriales bacterium]